MAATTRQKKGVFGPFKALSNRQGNVQARTGAGLFRDPCPECGSPLVHESGCTSCYSCGYAKCG